MVRLIIDTDPGVDDAHALMLALAHPQATVEALTTVAGNVDLAQTTANACTILDVLEIPPQQTPIFAGCDRALINTRVYASEIHGADGLGNSGFPRSPRRVEAEHASLALIRMATANPGALTLAAIGPLTNIALATRLDPTLPGKFMRLVVMGGAIRATGNMPYPSTEFNVHCDPEAAAIVFGAWPNLTLVSWETTMEHMFSPEQVETLMKTDTPRGRFFRRITEHTLAFLLKKLGRPGMFAPDGLAVAIAIEPNLVTQSETRAVAVELAGSHTRGQTTVDWFGLTGNTPHVHLVLKIDANRFWELMMNAVT
ncbi:MAG TPA: nucleoside hydrolase [bacterium]|jgi:purine nucleosidase|nr:nucleoside hydrolase [bacterium]